MIQIGQPKQSATVIRLNLLLAHGDGLLMPQDGNYGRPARLCNHEQSELVRRVLSVIAWLRKLSRCLSPARLSPLWDYFLFARHPAV
jgi:hypothetical protein